MGLIESGQMRRDFHTQSCDRGNRGTAALLERSKAVTQEELDAYRKEVHAEAVAKAKADGETPPPFIELTIQEYHNFGVENLVLEDQAASLGSCT